MKKLFSFMLLGILALSITPYATAASVSPEFSLNEDNDFFDTPESPEVLPDKPIIHFYGGVDEDDYDVYNISDEELKKQIAEPPLPKGIKPTTGKKLTKPTPSKTAAKTQAKPPLTARAVGDIRRYLNQTQKFYKVKKNAGIAPETLSQIKKLADDGNQEAKQIINYFKRPEAKK